MGFFGAPEQLSSVDKAGTFVLNISKHVLNNNEKKHRFFSRSYASHQRKNLKPDEFRQGMSYIENSALGLAYSPLRTNQKAGKLAFLLRQLNAEKLYSLCIEIRLQP